MKTNDLYFDLPAELIAQTPPKQRGSSRLMVYERSSGVRRHTNVAEIARFVPKDSVMVFNDSRVRKARIYGTPTGSASSGAPVELLLVRRLTDTRWLAMGRGGGRSRPGRVLKFESGLEGEIVGATDAYREIEFSHGVDDAWLDLHGHVPLPPYIDRPDTTQDEERYQTVYARSAGSVAAPTAGLHFTDRILNELRSTGITIVYVTLHVGIGTFIPIRTETIEDHTMHEEEFTISEDAAQAIETARSHGRPIVAVGTTSVRTLESAWDRQEHRLRRGEQSTSLYITPGYTYGVVDSIFTNFHTPRSTLIAMISAFTGREELLSCYREAIEKRYRFFSYGDAMLIL